MKDLKVVISDSSISSKTSIFNLLAKKKEVPKQTIGPVTYTRQKRKQEKQQKP
jgi:guanylate kinase